MPRDGRTIDLLAWALVLPGAEDPVEGIVDAVRVELDAMGAALPALQGLARRLDVAMQLLRITDERAPSPPMDESEDDSAPSPPADESEDEA